MRVQKHAILSFYVALKRNVKQHSHNLSENSTFVILKRLSKDRRWNRSDKIEIHCMENKSTPPLPFTHQNVLT